MIYLIKMSGNSIIRIITSFGNDGEGGGGGRGWGA
jgi:hypothetical protein